MAIPEDFKSTWEDMSTLLNDCRLDYAVIAYTYATKALYRFHYPSVETLHSLLEMHLPHRLPIESLVHLSKILRSFNSRDPPDQDAWHYSVNDRHALLAIAFCGESRSPETLLPATYDDWRRDIKGDTSCFEEIFSRLSYVQEVYLVGGDQQQLSTGFF